MWVHLIDGRHFYFAKARGYMIERDYAPRLFKVITESKEVLGVFQLDYVIAAFYGEADEK